MQLRLFLILLLLLLLWLASSHCFTDTFTTACCRFKVWFFKVNIVTCCPYSSVVPMACFSLPVSLLPPACSLSACLWPASHLLLLNGCMMGQHPDSTVFPQCTPHCSVCKLTSDQSVCRCSRVQGRWNCSCGLFWIMWFGKDSGRFQLLCLVMLVCVWMSLAFYHWSKLIQQFKTWSIHCPSVCLLILKAPINSQRRSFSFFDKRFFKYICSDMLLTNMPTRSMLLRAAFRWTVMHLIVAMWICLHELWNSPLQ